MLINIFMKTLLTLFILLFSSSVVAKEIDSYNFYLTFLEKVVSDAIFDTEEERNSFGKCVENFTQIYPYFEELEIPNKIDSKKMYFLWTYGHFHM